MASEIISALKKSQQVTLNANGQGTIIFDPDHANQRWEVTAVVVGTNQAATATTVPIVTLALNTTSFGTLSAGNNAGGSWNGNQDTFTGQWDIGPCDFLTVMFTPPAGASGSPLSGVIGFAVVTGTKHSRRG